jgi:uncharacterized protein
MTTSVDTAASTRATVDAFLAALAAGTPEQIAALFADQVDWYIPGNQVLAPWLGQRQTRGEVAAFFRLLRANVEPLRADVHQILVDGEAAIVAGEFASRMLATGKVVESLFFIQLTVQRGQIARYRLLEDSYAVVEALTA